MPIQIIGDKVDYIDVRETRSGKVMVQCNVIERNNIYKLLGHADGKQGQTAGAELVEQLQDIKDKGHKFTIDVAPLDNAFWIKKVNIIKK